MISDDIEMKETRIIFIEECCICLEKIDLDYTVSKTLKHDVFVS
jgi:hypothetical protein